MLRKVTPAQPFLQHRFRFLSHAAVVEKLETENAAGEFRAEKQIGGRIEMIRQRQGLVDRTDADFDGVRVAVHRQRMAVEVNCSGSRLIDARQDLDQRRLARAIVADDRQNFTGSSFEIDAVESGYAAESLGDPRHRDDRFRVFNVPLPMIVIDNIAT